jgi:hypothetical protein
MIDVKAIVERYKDDLLRLNARVYNHTEEEDMLLLKWWMALKETGDIERLITKTSQRLVEFLALFNQPTALLYGLSEKGEIELAYWLTPLQNNVEHPMAHCAYWTSPSIRTGTKKHINFTRLAYLLAFEFFESLLGTTWQPELLEIHEKLGYVVVSCVPWLNDHEFSYIVYLTRDAFMQSRLMQVAERSTT